MELIMTIFLTKNKQLIKHAQKYIENLILVENLKDCKRYLSIPESEYDMWIIDWETIKNTKNVDILTSFIIEKNPFIKSILIIKDNLPCAGGGLLFQPLDLFKQVLKNEKYKVTTITKQTFIKSCKELYK
jgi:hypothetical protein